MTKVYYILLSCLILVNVPILAQEPEQPVRLELEMKEYPAFEVIALPDSSLLLYTKQNSNWNTKTGFQFTKYDHQLNKVWSTIEELNSKDEFIGYAIEEPYVYLAFDEYASRKFQFLKLNIHTGDATVSEYEIPAIDAINEFSVLKGHYYVIGSDRKDYKPAFYHINSDNGQISLLPSVYGNESYFSDLLTDSERNRAYAVLLESNGRVSHLHIKTFNATGNLTGTYFTPPQRDKLFLQTEISTGDTTNKLLIGAYGLTNVNHATGFYTMPLQNNEGKENFYSFLDLENSLKHLSRRQEKRIRKKEQNRLEKRKLPNLRQQLFLHNLISTPEGYILTAEVYSSHYKSNGSRITIPDLPTFHQDKIYKHTHALVLAFNKSGELLWDNNFKLNEIITDDLAPTIEVAAAADGRFLIAYPDEKEIVYRIIERGAFTDEETKLTLRASNEGDKIASVYEHGVISWYGSNFAAFGVQRINPASGEGRSVFYINKITF